MNDDGKLFAKLAVGVVAFAAALIALVMFAWPIYSVWASEMAGKARLAAAEHDKRIMVEQAKAEVESAKLRAEAIALVGKAAKDFPEYRHQEFIAAFGEAMQNGEIQKIIYVPTEANIPIVEARGQ